MTEFGAQGLELDAILLAWGTDFIRVDNRWSNAKARGYKRGAHVRDPFQLRMNAYRVLLTRGRDVSVVFIPRLEELDKTYLYLSNSGFHCIDKRQSIISQRTCLRIIQGYYHPHLRADRIRMAGGTRRGGEFLHPQTKYKHLASLG